MLYDFSRFFRATPSIVSYNCTYDKDDLVNYMDCYSEFENVELEGKHAAIMAYGQTGSGKTHMMEGQFDERENWGIIPFAIEELLARTSR